MFTIYASNSADVGWVHSIYWNYVLLLNTSTL